jgi:glycosyltransferase involved in cell wall biosynthesis
MNFAHEFLYEGDFESRPRFKTCWKLYRSLGKLKFKKIIVGGWELPESWLSIFTHRKSHNAFALESSMAESQISGYKSLIKKLFLSRLDTVFCSGSLHQKLVQHLGYTGKVYITQGVGIFNRPFYQAANKSFDGKFLYVGRFAEEKNLRVLIEVFKGLSQYQLDLIGSGPLRASLEAMAPENVHFYPYVPNQQLAEIYAEHDVFILPSLREPWGLVVDEALFYGLPVLVSNKVGCYPELVQRYQSGLVFGPTDKIGLKSAIEQLANTDLFDQLKANVRHIDFSKRDIEQVQAYIMALDKKGEEA